MLISLNKFGRTHFFMSFSLLSANILSVWELKCLNFRTSMKCLSNNVSIVQGVTIILFVYFSMHKRPHTSRSWAFPFLSTFLKMKMPLHQNEQQQIVTSNRAGGLLYNRYLYSEYIRQLHHTFNIKLNISVQPNLIH